jgi:hypothetical protein
MLANALKGLVLILNSVKALEDIISSVIIRVLIIIPGGDVQNSY